MKGRFFLEVCLRPATQTPPAVSIYLLYASVVSILFRVFLFGGAA